MKHEIDLKNTNIHTDLLVEQIKSDLYESYTTQVGNCKITTIDIDKTMSKELNKKEEKIIRRYQDLNR